MSTPKFAETHNLVAFLEKPEEINRFKEIIDFLNESSVQYALSIQALVDKKKVIISETSIRSDLKLDDDEGIDCLPTATIFAELERMGAKTTAWNEFSRTMASAIICLAINQKFNISRVESSNDVNLGAQEDASKQWRKITDLDADAKVTLVDETQEINDDNLMFDTDELTLAQTLIEIKTAKPKPVTTAATTVTSVRPRAKGIIFHDQEEQVSASTKTFASSQSQLPQVKDKGKGIMVEPEVPLKKKDQGALDEEMARNLEAQLQAELIKEESLARQKEEEANITLIES
ncbi:hypothetical protein Tco_0545678 [Tanacetum coccineum]